MKFDGELITSRQNRRVVELAKLTDRKAREASKSFRFDGIKLLEEAIKNGVSPDTIFLLSVIERYISSFLFFFTSM